MLCMTHPAFLVQVANAAVLRLTKEAMWVAEAVKAIQDGALRDGEDTFIDRSVQMLMSAAALQPHASHALPICIEAARQVRGTRLVSADVCRAFDNDVSAAVAVTHAAYENLEFREALKVRALHMCVKT